MQEKLNTKDLFENDETFLEVIRKFALIWNARSSTYCNSLITVSRIVNDLFRNELKTDNPDPEFLERINTLRNKIQKALDSDPSIVFESRAKASHQFLNEEDYNLLMEMKVRELKRVDRSESRQWNEYYSKCVT